MFAKASDANGACGAYSRPMGRGKRQKREAVDYLAFRRREEAIAADPELARCCPAPDFAKARQGTYKQRCRTCLTWHTGASLEAAQTLEVFPASKCAHAEVEPLDILGVDRFGQPYQCTRCRLCWRRRPDRHQAGKEFSAFYAKWMDDWEMATGLIHLRMQNAASEAARPAPRGRTSSLAG